MADITITIPNGVLSRVVDAVAKEYNYRPGSETKGEFAKRQLIEFLKRTVKDAERSTAISSAVSIVEADVESSITLS